LVIVDTSLWISHLRAADAGLAEVLEAGEAMCHPFVIGELACGNLNNRAAIIALLQVLPSAPVAQHEEVLAFIDAHGLMGKGLGFIDIHLLASALLSGVPLWTRDMRLAKAAAEMHCAYGRR
jgi:predicted nucleic acid-binding protein